MRIHTYLFVLAMLFPFSLAWADPSGADNPSARSKTGSLPTLAHIVNEVTDKLGRDLGIKDQSVAQNAVTAMISAGITANPPNLEMPLIGEAKTKLAAALKAEGKQASPNKIEAALKRAWQSLHKHGITSAEQVVNDYRNSNEFKHLQTSNREAADRIDSGLQKANTYRESAALNYQKAKEQREIAQKLEQFANFIDSNPVAFNTWLAKQGLAHEPDPNKIQSALVEYVKTHDLDKFPD